MFDFLQAYKRYDPASKSLIEIALLYPGPKAILLHRIAHYLYSQKLYFLARFVSEINRWLTAIEIHPGAKIGERLVIDHGAGIVIGETAEVGNDCILFHGVTLGGINFEPVKRHPIIGDHVLLGTGAKILGPISVGNGAKVGANAVLTHDLQAGKTAVGIPARVMN